MERLLTVQQVADLLGIKVQTIYLWVAQKRIPHRKIGRLVRFRMCDVEEFVEQRRRLPVEVKHEHL